MLFILAFVIYEASFATKRVYLDKEPIVFIDAGHGGFDGGCVYNGISEKTITLPIAISLKQCFDEIGYKTHISRNKDMDYASDPNHKKRSDLNERIRMINNSNCDLFISIHVNSYPDSKYRGAQTFFTNNDKKNAKLAKNIQDSMISYLGNTERMEKEISNVYLLDNLFMTGCLVECGFLSNEDEFKLLNTKIYQEKVALAIYHGVLDYLSNQ